jgi:hypothetical protein
VDALSGSSGQVGAPSDDIAEAPMALLASLEPATPPAISAPRARQKVADGPAVHR